MDGLLKKMKCIIKMEIDGEKFTGIWEDNLLMSKITEYVESNSEIIYNNKSKFKSDIFKNSGQFIDKDGNKIKSYI